MNIALEHLARQLDLDAPHHETLRLAFGLACTRRVEHLLEASQAVDCLAILGRYLDGACNREQLAQAAAIASHDPRVHEFAAGIHVWAGDGEGARRHRALARRLRAVRGR